MNISSPPCGIPRFSATWRLFALQLLWLSLLAATPVTWAQTYGGVQVARTGSTFTFGARNFGTGMTTARFRLVSTPDDSDTFPSGTVRPIDAGGNVNLPIALGATPGVRIIRFCADDQVTVCDPALGTAVVHIGAVSAQCSLVANPSPMTGSAPLQGTLAASCNINTGANIQLSSNSNYGWGYSGPTGQYLTIASDRPPATATSTVNFTAPGTFFVNINPSLHFRITRTVLYSDTTDAINNPLTYSVQGVQALITAATNQPPTVTLTAPVAGNMLTAPRGVNLAATAQDSDGTVTGVDFLVDGNVVGSDTTPPYQAVWQPSTPGQHTFAARATDNTGAKTDTLPLTLTVLSSSGNLPPTVRLTAPAPGLDITAPASVELAADAQDSDGTVEQVEYLADGQLVAQSTTAPFTARWNAVPAGTYSLVARVTDNLGGTAESTPVRLVVRPAATQLSVITLAAQLRFEPGVSTAVMVSARDTRGQPVAGAQLRWSVARAEPLPAAAPKAAACDAADSPASGEATTNSSGDAEIRFLPGCNSANRRLSVSLADTPGNQLTVELRGPDAQVGNLQTNTTTSVVVVQPQQPTPISVDLLDPSGAPVPGATVVYTLSPPDAGSITPSSTSDSSGHASATLLLNANAVSATIQACVASRPDLCVNLPVSSSIAAVADPAENLIGPIAQQALDAPRTQLSLIGNRLQALRNETAHGFSSDVAVSLGGLTLPLAKSSTEGGDSESKEGARPSLFAAGTVEIAALDSRSGRRNGFDATTRGLTVGMDYRFRSSFVAGLALGGMRSSTDLSAGGSQSASGYSGSLYALWLPSEKLYLNTALNLGRSDFDSERSACGIDLHSDTQSRHRALLLEAGYSMSDKAYRFTPFLRYEYARASLDGLRERGNCASAISVDATRLSRSAISAGFSADRAFSTRSGVWIPSVALEVFGENEDRDEIFARLIADSSTAVPVTLEEIDKRYAMLRFAVSWMTSVKAQPISGFAGFDMSIGRSNYRSRAFMLGVKIPF
ncbi:MAG: autotransporter domain-containing protein [Rhodanobacteraceae bacterium]|nr:autotransporter domain-containing protein [Rhodanobacteraceae bacterium]